MNHLGTLIAIQQHTRNLGVQKLAFIVFSGLFEKVFDPLYFGGL
jgi:hypothetical protein